jgi:hypothetical protein
MKTFALLVLAVTLVGTSALACPRSVPTGVNVVSRTHGNIFGNNGATLYWTYTDASFSACGGSYHSAYTWGERVATRWSRDAHRNRLNDVRWTPNSQRDWNWGFATADWHWFTEYFLRKMSYISHGCRSARRPGSSCGYFINFHNGTLQWHPSGNAGHWNNQMGD